MIFIAVALGFKKKRLPFLVVVVTPLVAISISHTEKLDQVIG